MEPLSTQITPQHLQFRSTRALLSTLWKKNNSRINEVNTVNYNKLQTCRSHNAARSLRSAPAIVTLIPQTQREGANFRRTSYTRTSPASAEVYSNGHPKEWPMIIYTSACDSTVGSSVSASVTTPSLRHLFPFSILAHCRHRKHPRLHHFANNEKRTK